MPPASRDTVAGTVAPPPNAFHFGHNWQRYLNDYLDPNRERIAAESIQNLVGELAGKRFMDIGCGSGLFSLCAHRAGAREVISLDVDPDAVSCASELRARAGSPPTWHILHRSILDPRLQEELAPADIVYSWGVLHHTGDMYTAIRNATAFVKPGGLLVIAIYNRVEDRFLGSERWWHIKRAYNHAPRAAQAAMQYVFALDWLLRQIRYGRNPLRVARDYRRERGMALWTDLVDWLGGYPYEYASTDEIVDFCERSCALRTIRTIPVTGTGNNEFVFQRPVA